LLLTSDRILYESPKFRMNYFLPTAHDSRCCTTQTVVKIFDRQLTFLSNSVIERSYRIWQRNHSERFVHGILDDLVDDITNQRGRYPDVDDRLMPGQRVGITRSQTHFRRCGRCSLCRRAIVENPENVPHLVTADRASYIVIGQELIESDRI
jgi:hypothetical protein